MRAKVIYCLILNILLYKNLFAQPKPFELTIHVAGIQIYEVGLVFPIDNQQLNDKITVIKVAHGVYVAKGELEYPVLAEILIKGKRYSPDFFIEPGVQQIHTHLDSLRRPITVEGSKSNEEYLHKFTPTLAAHKKAVDQLSKDYSALYSRYDEKIPPRVEDSILVIEEKNRELRNTLVQQYVKDNPSSYVGFWMLYDLFRKYSYKEAYEKAFNSLSPKIKQSQDGAVLKNGLGTTKQLLAGKPFPKLKLVDSLGAGQILPTFSARYTLVDFWYSNCGPCIAQFEKLKELYARYQAKGFTIIGVSTDKRSNEEDWKRIMLKYALPWAQLWDIEGVHAEKLNITLLPTNFLLDEKGKILFRDLELYQLEEYLSKQLK